MLVKLIENHIKKLKLYQTLSNDRTSRNHIDLKFSKRNESINQRHRHKRM